MRTYRSPQHPGGNMEPRRIQNDRQRGFTLPELAVVIVIIGIILAAAGSAWMSLLDARRLAETKSQLLTVKSCLIKRMLHNNTYPSYTGATTLALGDNLECGVTISGAAFDVDTCLCQVEDAWGNEVFYLEGVVDNPSDDPLALTERFIEDNTPKGQNATNPDQTRSALIDINGNQVNYVVFALISSGADRNLDDATYRDRFDTDGDGTVDIHASHLDPTSPPNFDRDTLPDYPGAPANIRDDDILVYLTATELKSLIAQ